MFKLNELTSLTKKRKRVGRGGSRGGTSGKGHKGQKARSGGSISAAFEGGQMSISRRIPKRGFNNHRFKKEYAIVSLDLLEKFFNDGDSVDMQTLIAKNCISKKYTQFKVLGSGTLTKKLTVHTAAYSKSAHEKIVEVGGQVVTN